VSMSGTPPSPKASMDQQTCPEPTGKVGDNGAPLTSAEIVSRNENKQSSDRNSSSGMSNGKENFKKTTKKPLQQMYLDLGQRSFGERKMCSVCGMLYVAGLEEDMKQHSNVCKDYKEGVSFQASNARVVANFGKNACAIEVRSKATMIPLP